MKEHRDKYLVIAMGEVVAVRYSFEKALKVAKQLARKTDVPHYIDAIEQLVVASVDPTGRVAGRES